MLSILSGNDMTPEMDIFFKHHYQKLKAHYLKKIDKTA